MASHYYGSDMGGGFDPSGVSIGTSTTSKKVEVVVVDGVSGNNKAEVLKALEKIVAYITKANAPA